MLIRWCCRAFVLVVALLFADWAVAESFEVRLVKWVQVNMADGFERGQFSSAALSVVRSEEEILSITFGLSDAQACTIAHPYRTRFRVSSISKVFSAVAISQLLQEGRIESLDDPVNAYLRRFRLPDNDGEPITIHHLLTHSAGFDYSNFGLYSLPQGEKDMSAMQPQQLMPRYVRPVGQWAVYSNYGGALLGVLVEDVSGEPLEMFLRKRLFTPLGMEQTRLIRRERSVSLAIPS